MGDVDWWRKDHDLGAEGKWSGELTCLNHLCALLTSDQGHHRLGEGLVKKRLSLGSWRPVKERPSLGSGDW